MWRSDPVTLSQIAIGLAGDALIGALAGFFAAVIALQCKHARNAIRLRRGMPGIRDCVLPLVFVPLCAVLGAIIGGVLAEITPWSAAPGAVLAAIHVVDPVLAAVKRPTVEP